MELKDLMKLLTVEQEAVRVSKIKAERLGLAESFACGECGRTVGKKGGVWKLYCDHHPKPKGLPSGINKGAFSKIHTKRDWVLKDAGIRKF